jgi:hypothetical protein
MASDNQELADFLSGKPEHALMLFEYFTGEFKKLGSDVSLHPAKTMLGIANAHKRIAWVTQFGKGFIHVVFPFKQAYPDNLCFIKIAQVPGEVNQFNHHFRMNLPEDLNEEVLSYMQLAYHLV